MYNLPMAVHTRVHTVGGINHKHVFLSVVCTSDSLQQFDNISGVRGLVAVREWELERQGGFSHYQGLQGMTSDLTLWVKRKNKYKTNFVKLILFREEHI